MFLTWPPEVYLTACRKIDAESRMSHMGQYNTEVHNVSHIQTCNVRLEVEGGKGSGAVWLRTCELGMERSLRTFITLKGAALLKSCYYFLILETNR